MHLDFVKPTNLMPQTKPKLKTKLFNIVYLNLDTGMVNQL